MGLNVLLAAWNKYGFGRYTYEQVQCNYLVQGALRAAGYIIPSFTTNHDEKNNRTGKIEARGLFAQADGSISDFAKQYFDQVTTGMYQAGDIILFRNKNGGVGHMGIFYGYDQSHYPMFYGSQSHGPELVDTNPAIHGSYWGIDPMVLVGVLRPKDCTHTGVDITPGATQGTGLTCPGNADPGLHYYEISKATQTGRLYDKGVLYIKNQRGQLRN